ncbi:MAG: 4Fe-4S binding protein [Methanocorpusculum sp.]|nr:4Fe-4S binding protein [Methanocorpusculum sp.]
MINIKRDVCAYCGACVSVCPHGALELIDAYLSVDETLCRSRCRICETVCPLGAIHQEETASAEEIKKAQPLFRV